MRPRRNPLDERWSLNTVRWLETGPYAHVPAVRRLADELRHFEGPRTATEYRIIKGKIERVFNALEARDRLEPEDDAAAITRALLEGSLGIAESGVARPMPGTRQGPLRDIEERHPQAGRRQRERETQAARADFADIVARRTRLQQDVGAVHTLAALRAEAEAGATLQGHPYIEWREPPRYFENDRSFLQYGRCTRCAAEAILNTRPRLEDLPITGSATTRPCAAGQTTEERTAEAEDPLVKEWNLGYDLDGGGYSFERVRGTPLGNAVELLLHEDTWLSLAEAQRIVERMIMWDSPDLDYIIGSDDLPRHRADLLLIAPGRGDLSWPDKIPEPDAEGNLGNLMFEKRAEGQLLETDHDCMWCGAGTGRVPSPDPNCRRCIGDGLVNSPGGAWAVYERVEIEAEEPRPGERLFDEIRRREQEEEEEEEEEEEGERTLEELREEAEEAAESRHHTIDWGAPHGSTQLGECSRCGRSVSLDTHPPPNGIDISGDAVAVNCIKCEVDTDEATYLGDAVNGVFFQACQHEGSWWMSAFWDGEHNADILVRDAGPFDTEEAAQQAGEDAAKNWCIDNHVSFEDDEEEEGDPDELLTIDLDSDEIDILRGWYSGQGDPLYALQSSGSIRRGDISSATLNLSSILRRSELGEAVLDGEDDVATINDLIAKLERAARLNR